MAKAEETEYVTWIDFTQRMQGTSVSQEDWALFYKRYMGFIHDRCTKKGWLDFEQEIMDRCVLKFNDEEIKKVRHDHPGSLRAWMYSVIESAYKDTLKAHKAKKNNFIINETSVGYDVDQTKPEDIDIADEKEETNEYKYGISPTDNSYIDKHWDEEKLWQCYVSYIVFDLIQKNTSKEQYQVFVWRVCKNRTVEEIVQATGCTKKQVYEYSREVCDKLRNQFKKFGEMPAELAVEDWGALQQKAIMGYKHYRTIADDFSTRYMVKK